MRKGIEHKILWLMWIITGLWLLYFVVSIWWHVHNEGEKNSEVLFQVMNALFSGLAIIVACLSLAHKKDTFYKQIDITTFTETIPRIIESDNFNKCRMYILSNQYNRDINSAKRLLKKRKIYLEDIKNFYEKKAVNRFTSSMELEDLFASYKNISFFCSEMDYLGTLYDKGIASDFIIEYYNKLIVESYDKLSPILSDPNEVLGNYPHYAKIYIAAKSLK